ncbi:g10031 [Coccomyxa elongata]
MTYALASALSRGGKFILSPPMPTPYEAYVTGFESFRRSIRLRAFFGNDSGDGFDSRYHVPKPNWQPGRAARHIEAPLRDLHAQLENAFAGDQIAPAVSNVPHAERLALYDLRRRPDIIVKPADKNLGLTLMGRDWYMQECYRQLSDEEVYQEIAVTALLPEEIKAKALHCVASMHKLGLKANEKKWLVHHIGESSSVPKFYTMPKLHKEPVKGRPIVASCGWCTTPLSQWCANTLAPIVAQLPTVLKDTADLLRRLEGVRFSADAEVLLSTADVESLYTSIPVEDALEALGHTLRERRVDAKEGACIKLAVRFVLSNNYLTFDDECYKQIKGLAMGTPLAPPLANIFMAYLEKKTFASRPGLCPVMYGRFLDDIFYVQVLKNIPYHVLRKALGNMHPSIRLTFKSSPIETEMLDLVIYRAEDHLLHRVHQKALNKYLYISPLSCHPPHVMRGFIRSEIIRYARNCSERLDFLRICRAFSSRLRERGFHPTFLRNVFATVEHGYDPPKGKRATPMVFKIPYGGGPEISALPGVIREWYDACPLAFRTYFPKPVVCYTMGRNVYGLLVRAKVPT